MERSTIALIAGASFALASGGVAQQPAPRDPPAAGQSQGIQVSDADIETFADIYVDLLDTEAKFEEELAGVQTEEQARDVQTRMEQESVAKLARRGWSAERYVLVGEAIKSDATLTERTIAKIEERD
jgi:hypothetical protein